MKLHGAKKHAEKLLAFIEELQDKDGTLYAKSKKKLADIADICEQVADVIRELVETANSDSENGNHSSRKPLQAQIDSLSSEVSEIKQLLLSKNEGQSVTANKISVPVKCEKMSDKKDKKYTQTECAKIVSKYRITLENNAQICYEMPAASMCASMLWEWFDARYLTQYAQAPKFRYSVINIKDYIHAFIITFGYHYERGTVDKFRSTFDSWLYSLKTSERSNLFVVPYEVAQVGKCVTKDYATLTAALIWDAFCDNGLIGVCSDDYSDTAYTDRYAVRDRVFSVNPELAHRYVELGYAR